MGLGAPLGPSCFPSRKHYVQILGHMVAISLIGYSVLVLNGLTFDPLVANNEYGNENIDEPLQAFKTISFSMR